MPQTHRSYKNGRGPLNVRIKGYISQGLFYNAVDVGSITNRLNKRLDLYGLLCV